MSHAPHPPRTARRYAWLRVLVVLAGLLVAGAYTEAVEADSAPASAVQACDADYDVLAPAPRTAALQGPRTVTPLRPGPHAAPAPSGPDDLPPASVRTSRSAALHALRTVVLRC
ncbi:hypothetical protein ACU639_17885 [Streptomyces cynarae]|uniref:hypothetical protein n=1 Tax=Streptomyces cynarae TaxID=2981134 RepID=UPI00406D494F